MARVRNDRAELLFQQDFDKRERQKQKDIATIKYLEGRTKKHKTAQHEIWLRCLAHAQAVKGKILLIVRKCWPENEILTARVGDSDHCFSRSAFRKWLHRLNDVSQHFEYLGNIAASYSTETLHGTGVSSSSAWESLHDELAEMFEEIDCHPTEVDNDGSAATDDMSAATDKDGADLAAMADEEAISHLQRRFPNDNII